MGVVMTCPPIGARVCMRGHVVPLGQQCLMCHREYDRKWRAENPEKSRESCRKWRAENPEKARASSKWSTENPEKRRESDRKRRAANPEKWRENCRKWRAENPEKAREHVRRYSMRRAIASTAAEMQNVRRILYEINSQLQRHERGRKRTT